MQCNAIQCNHSSHYAFEVNSVIVRGRRERKTGSRKQGDCRERTDRRTRPHRVIARSYDGMIVTTVFYSTRPSVCLFHALDHRAARRAPRATRGRRRRDGRGRTAALRREHAADGDAADPAQVLRRRGGGQVRAQGQKEDEDSER